MIYLFQEKSKDFRSYFTRRIHVQLVEMVQTAAALQPEKSTSVSICIDWFPGKKHSDVQKAINRTDNEQKQKFIKGLLETISMARHHEADKQEAAKKELVELFGEEILTAPAITNSRDGFFFSLTSKGTQFRGWYAPFGSVNYDHFDSCGHGIVFHVHCEDPSILRRWLQPIVGQRIEWHSGFGSVWIGYGRGGYVFS